MYNYGYFSDDTNKYSINLMFDYININKPSKIKLNISELLFNLNWNSLRDNVKPIDIYLKISQIKNINTKSRVLNAQIQHILL